MLFISLVLNWTMKYIIKILKNIIFMLYILTASYKLAYGIQSSLYTFHVKTSYDVNKCIKSSQYHFKSRLCASSFKKQSVLLNKYQMF